MAYTIRNYKTKKDLIIDVKSGKQIRVYQPGPFGSDVSDGQCFLEGPHYPQAHSWYASATIKNGTIISVK